MRLVLLFGKSAPDLEHVHVVEGAGTGVGREIERLVDDVVDAIPPRRNVVAHAPGAADLADPGAWIVPAADVDPHARLHCVKRLADERVALLRVHVDLRRVAALRAAAEVDLDEVEAELLEEILRVLALVVPEPHADSHLVVVEDAAAGVLAAVGVDAGLEAERMDVVDDGLESVGEALRVRLEPSVLVASAEVAVVDVDVYVPALVELQLLDKVGVVLDRPLADVDAECVPRAPAHRRGLDVRRSGLDDKKKHDGREYVFHVRFPYFTSPTKTRSATWTRRQSA